MTAPAESSTDSEMPARERAAREVVGAVAGVPAESLRPEQHLMADLGIDSPKGLQLLMDLEDRLGVEISDEEAARLETVGDILEWVRRQP